MDVCLNLDGSTDSSAVLKYSALYFDEITLDTYLLGKTTIYPSEETFRDAKLLEKEGILKLVVFSPWENYSAFKQYVFEMVLEDLDNLTGMNPKEVTDFLLNWWCKDTGTPEHEKYSRILLKKTEVLDTIPSVIFGKNQNEITIDNMVTYYYILLYMLAWHQGGNEFPNILTNNRFLSNIMRKIVSKNRKEQSRESEIAVRSMKILLPYIRCSSMEEVLEIRNYAKDELLELSSYIDDLYKSIDIEKRQELSTIEIDKIVTQSVTPAIHQFERKLENLKLKVVKDFISNIANPLSYSPLITTFFNGVSPSLALAMSMGLISAKTAIDYKINQNEVKNDPLYFTVSLKKYIDPMLW